MYTIDLFNNRANEYDSWYSKHQLLAKSEEDTIKALGLSGLGLDVGAGSGFFTRLINAIALEPSPGMIKLAKDRTWAVVSGVGELMPIRDSSMDYVIIVVTLCFAMNPEAILRESIRVLKSNGRLVACIVPLESQWGALYSELGSRGHPYYSRARFLTIKQVTEALIRLGVRVTGYVATLSRGVGEYYEAPSVINNSDAGRYGFVCVNAVK
ncbi:class I SAM-dependent methyltransferase [Caldivirga maquilingensis]|uniref:Methyltransferase type 11 n=1 Tax=Caldivirga maquilingensis (strain ATCC 700844 / DSM 13496 / JCM 10307 / IC-167) TaxID=397948 RepID=A8MBR1_CALMQ|nr:class I SAM-dependent methyltransferase [Caldivirga maquilingensis]ABW01254.1 Methyltransferase type 11 [Caldivirga maquilingensis IC-167]